MSESPSELVSAMRAWVGHLKTCERCRAAARNPGLERCEAGRKLRLTMAVLLPPRRA